MNNLTQNKLLTDILDAISSVDEHLQEKRDYHFYFENKTQRRAVERELEIIGEAISKLLKLNPTIPISKARLIVDLRNRVIHAYDGIDHVLIWKIIIKDLPILAEEVKSLLK